jgi:hypothetical protein
MLMFLTSRVILSEGFVPASIFFVPLQKQIAAQKMLAPQEIHLLRIPTKADTDSENNRTPIPLQSGQLIGAKRRSGLVIEKCPIRVKAFAALGGWHWDAKKGVIHK